MYGGGASGDNALLEADHLLGTRLFLGLAVGHFNLDMVGVEEAAVATNDIDLAHLGHAGETAGKFADDLRFVCAQLVDVDLRRREGHATIGHVLGFIHDDGNVEQRLRRDAADVQTYPAERSVTLDDDRLQTEVGAAEGRRVAARTGTENEHFALDISEE